MSLHDNLYGKINVIEYDAPHQNDDGAWEYLYTYDISLGKVPKELKKEWVESLKGGRGDRYSETYERAWIHINEQFKHVKFCQREAGSVKCWLITLPERDDDLIQSEIIHMKLVFG